MSSSISNTEKVLSIAVALLFIVTSLQPSFSNYPQKGHASSLTGTNAAVNGRKQIAATTAKQPRSYSALPHASTPAFYHTGVVGEIHGLPASSLVAYDSVSGLTYFASSSGNLVSVVNQSGSVIAVIPVGNSPDDILFDPANGCIYVSNFNSANVSVINGTNVVASVSVLYSPTSLAFDRNNSLVFVSGTEYLPFFGFPGITGADTRPALEVVDNANRAVGIVPYGELTSAKSTLLIMQKLAFNPSNGYIYATDEQQGLVAAVKSTYNPVPFPFFSSWSFSVVSTIQVHGSPYYISYDPGNGNMFVSDVSGGSVDIISPSNSLLASVGAATGNQAVNPFVFDGSNGEMLVLNSTGNYLTPIAADNVAMGRITTGNAPVDAIFDPSNGYVYVSDMNSSTVSVIGGSNTLLTNLSVGAAPVGIAYNPGNTLIYVTNSQSNSATILGSWVFQAAFFQNSIPANNSCGTSNYWTVSMNGVSISSSGSSLEFLEQNGSYPYTVSSTGFHASPAGGTVTVNGGTINTTIAFTASVTFAEVQQYSGIFLTNVSQFNTIGVYAGIGPERPVLVWAYIGTANYSLTETNCSQGLYTLSSLNMGLLPPNSALDVYMEYSNTTVTRTVQLNIVSTPAWLMSLINNGLLLYSYPPQYEMGQWNNSYSIMVLDGLPFASILGVNSPLAVVGGLFSFIPDEGTQVLIQSAGSITMKSYFAAGSTPITLPAMSIASDAVGLSPSFPISFKLGMTGIFAVANDTIYWTSSTMHLSISGSITIDVPIVGYGFQVPDYGFIGIGLSLAFTIAPTIALTMALAAAKNSSYEFIPGLDMMITSIVASLSLPVTVAIVAGVGFANIEGGGTLTFNIILGLNPPPLNFSGNIMGELFLKWNALIWSGTIWSMSGQLYNWSDPVGATDPSGNFSVIPRYYNTSNYGDYVWKNGSWNGTAVNDIYPFTSVSAARSGDAAYILYSADNTHLPEYQGLGIDMIAANSTTRNASSIAGPSVRGEDITNPAVAQLPGGDIGALWDAVPYQDMKVANPFQVSRVTLQYSYYETGTNKWSKPTNVTTSGIANSFKLNYSRGSPFGAVLWSKNATSPDYFQIYDLATGTMVFNASINNASNIISYRSASQTSVIQLLNGSYILVSCNIATGALSVYQMPGAGTGYSVKQAGIAQNSSSEVYVLYQNGTYGYLFMVYNDSNLSSWSTVYYTPLSTAISMVRYIYAGDLSYLAESTNDTITIHPIGTLPGLVRAPGEEPPVFSFTLREKNITKFGMLDVNNTLVVYTLSNYGNLSDNLLNLSLTFEPLTAPPVPVLQIVSENATAIALKWSVSDASEYGILGYYLHTNLAVPGLSNIINLANTTVSYIVVPNGAGNYVFSVAAYNAFGISGYSNTAHSAYFAAGFDEKGLPRGTYWTTNLSGRQLTGNSTANSLALPNGTYQFTVSPSGGYEPFPSSGSINISGAAVSEAILFAGAATGVYKLVFDEIGLPNGHTWYVSVGGQNSSSQTGNVSFYETNGTYAYQVTSPAGYFASPSSGHITVQGSPVYREIAFATSPHGFYFVNFTEKGLRDSIQWSVSIGGLESTSGNGTVSFSLVNGTYSFIVNGVSGYSRNPSAGIITVSGSPITKSVVFTPAGSNPLMNTYLLSAVLIAAALLIAMVVLFVVMPRRKKKS